MKKGIAIIALLVSGITISKAQNQNHGRTNVTIPSQGIILQADNVIIGENSATLSGNVKVLPHPVPPPQPAPAIENTDWLWTTWVPGILSNISQYGNVHMIQCTPGPGLLFFIWR